MTDKFIIQKHLSINPLSQDFKNYWKQEKRRCIEGLWVDNTYVPGTLYFFANYWKIRLQRKKGGEYIGRPLIRDLEWEKALIYLEARGFSGFELDDEFSCDRRYNLLIKAHPDYKLIPKHKIKEIKDNFFNEGINIDDLDFSKSYISAREYLKKTYTKPLGKPLYLNEAKNIIDIECRGGGKSFNAASLIGNNFLFDGAKDYDEYLERLKDNNPLTSETVVGAIDSKYSGDLLSKVKLGLDELPGGCTYNNKIYPSPLSKSYDGSFTVNKFIEAVRKVKQDGNWVREGTRTKIHHRSFSDNPFAANGTRPNLMILEEVGFMGNLLDAYGNLTDCTTVNGRKFGVIWAFGTSGDMEGGSSLAAQKIFYNPEKYNCLVFENTYENNGYTKIGYFVPAHRKMLDFVVDGKLNVEAAKKHVEHLRDVERNKGKKEYSTFLQNNPEKPSEAFLVLDGNRFPVAELKDALGELLVNETLLASSYSTEFTLGDNDIVERYNSDKPIIREFPLRDKVNTTSCVEIYHLPKLGRDGKAMTNRYIAGWDCVEDDGKNDGAHSLQSVFVLDSFTDSLVAQYTGRSYIVKDDYEIIRRLLMYYNAVCNVEKNKKGPYAYFDMKKSLHLLANNPKCLAERQLQDIKAVGNESKGTHATDKVLNFGLDELVEWLESKDGDGIKNMNKIRCPALLNELIMYNGILNTDRVSSLIMLMILRFDYVARKEKSKVKEEVVEEDIWMTHYNKNIWNKNNNSGFDISLF